jgi:hypothetical protein
MEGLRAAAVRPMERGKAPGIESRTVAMSYQCIRTEVEIGWQLVLFIATAGPSLLVQWDCNVRQALTGCEPPTLLRKR